VDKFDDAFLSRLVVVVESVQPERVRQKKLDRKRRKREQKRQALRLRATPVLSTEETVLPFAKKMSDTLIEFARPLVDRLPVDPPVDDLKLVLTFASFVWNCVLNGANARELVLPNAQTALDVLGLSLSEGEVVVDDLIRRKGEMFAGDDRIVMGIKVYRRDGELRILAASAWS